MDDVTLARFADLVIGYFLRGLVPQLGRSVAAAVALLLWLPTAQAQEGEDRLVELANETRLAYVVTGDAAVDQAAQLGRDLEVLRRARVVVGQPPQQRRCAHEHRQHDEDGEVELEVEALHGSGRTPVDHGTTVIPSAARDL